ncbi:DegT/DnrJ/EryC1/StrS family aminotransferase [Candidatus Woesearchaeota archaeon]|nr:DegT/DnrJ/EryC1/StrS family aminotransferase [Candidatus Woesearchaeota archaeon]
MIHISKPLIGEEEKRAVNLVLDSGMLAQGGKTEEFEKKFSDYCKTKHSIAVNSGTAALHTALHSAGIHAGDEVITSPFTFVASANPIIMARARPVFADIKEDTFNIDPEKIKEKITGKTKAIIAVDLYGQIYNARALKEIAEDKNLIIIEDACQAVGAELDGKKSGAIGDIGCFSFYATKNLVTGEGGMITTDNVKFAESCRRFRHHGQSREKGYEYLDLGYNYRMTDIHAAIGIEQLKKIENFTNKRIENAKKLTKGIDGIKEVKTPFVKKGARHVFHQYTIRAEKRDKLKEYLGEQGIVCGVYYPKPLHMHPFFMKLGYKQGDFPNAEKSGIEVLSLPVHPALTEEDINKIIKVIGEFYA